MGPPDDKRPTFIARLSGLPANLADDLGSSELALVIDELIEQRSRVQRQREAMSVVLHEAIGAAATKAIRNALLSVRRDLYNGRLPAGDRIASACETQSAAVCQAILDCRDVLIAAAEAKARVRALYGAEQARVRARFQQMIGDEDFLNGVLLSSRTLFQNVGRYRRADPLRLGSRDEQIERGLLRYFTRASMKATPFATLCSVVAGEFDPNAARASLVGDTTRKRGSVRLNKALFGRVWAHVGARPRVREALAVEINPTTSVRDGQLWYLAAIGGREVFQRLRTNSAMELVIQLVRLEHSTRLDNLIERLMAEPGLEATRDEASAYIDSLINVGLLRFRPVVPDQVADWDVPLLRLLESVDDEHAAAAADLLHRLREMVDAFVTAPVSHRVDLLTRMRDALRETLTALGATAVIPNDLPVFEDAALDARCTIPQSPEMTEVLEALADLADLCLPLEWRRANQLSMHHFFQTYYAKRSVGRVPLLEFYEDYYREHFKDALNEKRRGAETPGAGTAKSANPFALASIDRIDQARKRIARIIGSAWAQAPEAEEIDIPIASLREASDGAGVAFRRDFASAAFFGQMVFDVRANAWRYVLRRPIVHQGFGKFFSRFLHILPPSRYAEVVERNRTLTSDLLAEISGDSHFNANLHPPLMSHELVHPNGVGTETVAAISVADLDIVAEPGCDELLLEHRDTRKPLYAFDLGFLNPLMRPALYQLLSNFTMSGGASFDLPLNPSDGRPTGMSGITAAVAPVGIVRRPRIVLGGRIVVARRRWLVEHTAFPPAEGGGEDDADVFLRVNLWRKALGIPDRVYVVVFPNQDHVVAEDAKAQMDAAPEAAELDGADVDAGTEPDEGTEPAVSSPVKAGE
jgi:hypothetical protein